MSRIFFVTKKSPQMNGAIRFFCSAEQKAFCVCFYFFGQFLVCSIGFNSLVQCFDALCAVFFIAHANDLDNGEPYCATRLLDDIFTLFHDAPPLYRNCHYLRYIIKNRERKRMIIVVRSPVFP